jgi:hypothetical protein
MSVNEPKVDKESKVMAAMSSYTYGIGRNSLMSYEATPLPDNSYIIRRPDDTCIQLSVGDTLPSVGVVGLDVNGNITVGEYTVPLGLSLSKKFTAKPINKEKTEFALIDESGKVREKYKLGEYTPKGTLVEQDQYGNLKLGSTSVKILPLYMKIMFQILKPIPKEEASKVGLFKGNRAVFNTYGQDLTNGAATFGYFVPRTKNTYGKKLGEFKEMVDGELVTTAELYPAGNNPNIASLRIRRPDVAYEAAVLFQEKIETNNMLKGLSDNSKVARVNQESSVPISGDLGFRAKDRLSLIESRLTELSKEWESSALFTVSTGKDFIKSLSPKRPDNSREPN